MKKFRRLLATIVACFMLLAVVAPTVNADDIATADDPRESVMMITLGYEDDGGNYAYAQWGSCFLINSEYVLTAKHVVTVENWNEFSKAVMETFGLNELKKDDKHIKIKIYVNRDMCITGTIDEDVSSSDLDFSLVKLSRPIADRSAVALGDSSTLNVKDKVYALGYPSDSIETDSYNTKEDVSIIEGSISKLNASNGGSGKFIEHSASYSGGISGGPLVNVNNEVVGVNNAHSNAKSYAVQINSIKSGLDTFGIAYSETAGSTIENNNNQIIEEKIEDNSVNFTELQDKISSAKGMDTSGYTSESVSALNTAISNAEAIVNNSNASQDEVNAAVDNINSAVNGLTEKSGMNMGIIIGGAIAAVVVIAGIIFAATRGKKKSAPVQPNYSAATPPTPQPSYGEETTVLNNGAGETTLLDSGAGETTLLNGRSAAYLIRKKNGERITINQQNFKIGKERTKVNYCVSDNSSVSRVHCEIVRKGEDYFVVDNGSTNFTFVNGIQVSPRKETLLADSSVLKVSDEEFEFHQG